MQNRKLRQSDKREVQTALLRQLSRLHKRLDQAESRARKEAKGESAALHSQNGKAVSSGKAAASAGLLARYNMAVDALRKIGTYEDKGASAYLEGTKSYSAFDEPGSVQIARECLRKLREDV